MYVRKLRRKALGIVDMACTQKAGLDKAWQTLPNRRSSMDEGHECDKPHILSPLTDRLQIVILEDVVCTTTVTIIVIPSVPYILVQKESQHWISPPSLCKIFIERSREAHTARYWQKGELQF
jgi:hypothetical protein